MRKLILTTMTGLVLASSDEEIKRTQQLTSMNNALIDILSELKKSNKDKGLS